MNVAARTINVLSICAGVGGLDIGIRIAVPHARTVCFIERESFAASTLVARMEDAALEQAAIWDDLTTFDGLPWRGRVHLVTAGLPCQPYSIAGKQRGHEDERAIWPEFIRVVGEVQPWLVFIENVPAFLQFFRPVGDELQRLGYRVEEPLFVTAAECGGSHERERLFILAHRLADPMQPRGQQIPRGTSGHEAADGGTRRDAREPDGDNQSSGACEGVALPTRGGFGSVRESSGRDGLTGGGNARMDDAEGQRPGETRELHPGPPERDSGTGGAFWNG